MFDLKQGFDSFVLFFALCHSFFTNLLEEQFLDDAFTLYRIAPFLFVFVENSFFGPIRSCVYIIVNC